MKQSIRIIQRKRNRTVDLQGTAPLSFLNSGDIGLDADAGGWILDFEVEAKTSRYYPFDLLEINNQSASGLNLYINQNQEWKKIVRNGTIQTITDFKGVRGIRLSKRDAAVTITAGQIEVTVMRQSLTDDEYRRRELSNHPVRKILKTLLGV